MTIKTAIQQLKQHWRKLAIWLLVIIPLAPFVIGTLLLVIYMYWPINYDKLIVDLPKSNEGRITVLAHGLKDNSASWSQPLKQIFSDKNITDNVIALDWSDYAQDVFRCSVDGMRIGALVARKINREPSINSVHLVGHSCGSFVVLGLCKELKKLDNSLQIHTTYLDPVSVYGGIFWDYGLSHFGRCADFSDAYIDTRDNVPGSNRALAHSYTFDVTNMSQQASFSGRPHLWPIQFYLNQAKQDALWSLEDKQQISDKYRLNQLQKLSTNNKASHRLAMPTNGERTFP